MQNTTPERDLSLREAVFDQSSTDAVDFTETMTYPYLPVRCTNIP